MPEHDHKQKDAESEKSCENIPEESEEKDHDCEP